MKKILTILLILCLMGCSQKQEEKEIVEPESFEPSTSMKKQVAYYIGPIADKDGKMVIPLSADVGIITTDEQRSDFMKKTFEETVLFYHILLDPSHEFEGVNNIKIINDNYGKGPVKVNEELIDILSSAIELSKNTSGYFNPTIGVLSDVWKDLFNAEHINKDPDPIDIEKAKASSIPYEDLDKYIVLDKANSTVEFKKYENCEKVKIDLGAYSKGYVMDKVYDALLKYKCGFLISAGGSSIVCYIEPTQEKLSWVIGIKNPDNGSSCTQIKLKNGFISTSGDAEQFFINENGIRRHHILNPFTGYPENNYRSITLVSTSEAGALDGLSTALYNAEDINETISNIETDYNIKVSKALITQNDEGKLLLEYDDSFNEYLYDIDYSQITEVSK